VELAVKPDGPPPPATHRLPRFVLEASEITNMTPQVAQAVPADQPANTL
jgi:hypothetical protein